MSKLVSKNLVDFVKSFEGFSATKYLDEVGIPTLGYGMTGDEIKGLDYVTEEQASEMLENWLNEKYASVLKEDLNNKGITLTQNQFDALVSMAYNVGTGGVLGSTLYRNICNGVRDVATITANFTAWSYAGGKQLAGLLRRRQDEAKMFFGTGNTVDGDLNTLSTETIKLIQSDLNRIGIKDNTGNKLIEDGIWGINTTGAMSNFQYVIGLSTNGQYDSNTCVALNELFNKPILQVGSKGYPVKYLQWYLGCDRDGIFGINTKAKVIEWQNKVGLVADGIVGQNSWNKIF